MPTPSDPAISPTSLRCDLLARPDLADVSPQPRFRWQPRGGAQIAWQVLVASRRELLDAGKADLWDSGRVDGEACVAVPCGTILPAGPAWWKVRTWTAVGPGPWAAPQEIRVGAGGVATSEVANAEAVQLHPRLPRRLERLPDGAVLADFGDAMYGGLRLRLDGGEHGRTVVVHLAERLVSGRVDRCPPGHVRHRMIPVQLPPGRQEVAVPIAAVPRHSHPSAVQLPPGIPEMTPFRYAEIEGLDALPPAEALVQTAAYVDVDRWAADFRCDDPVLEAVWRLCAHTIVATTAFGVYIDGDRERIAYEGDAYVNQLAHYAIDNGWATARATIARLLACPTWPTEWQLCMPLMAWEDYLHSGDDRGLHAWYEVLAAKSLIDLAGNDGLISTTRLTPELLRRVGLSEMRDLVDWPPGSFTQGGTGERDGHEMPPVNTVVNAYHAAACTAMGRIARVVGRDATPWFAQAARVEGHLDAALWDAAAGAYVDGVGSRHHAQHSTMFPLAFGLVPEERQQQALDFTIGRGMACSVYGAHFLLDALYRHGRADAALDLMTATHDRSWYHMLLGGSTMTLEAWDWRYKNNLDWNHAWACGPLAAVARGLLGVRPASPGAARLSLRPQPGRLRWVRGRVPTARGPVTVEIDHEPGRQQRLLLDLPAPAELALPGGNRDLPAGRHELIVPLSG